MLPDILHPSSPHSSHSPIQPRTRRRNLTSQTKASLSSLHPEVLARMIIEDRSLQEERKRVQQANGEGMVQKGKSGSRNENGADLLKDLTKRNYDVVGIGNDRGQKVKGDSWRGDLRRRPGGRGGASFATSLRESETERMSKRRRTGEDAEADDGNMGTASTSRDEEQKLIEALLERERQLILENKELQREIRVEEAHLRGEEERKKKVEEDTMSALRNNPTMLSSDEKGMEGSIAELISSLLKANDASLSSSLSIYKPSGIGTITNELSKKEEEGIPSVLPLKPKNPLPQLQAFIPLTFQQPQTRILPKSSASPSDPLLEHHVISGHSHNPLKLLNFRIEMTVDTSALQVVSLTSHVSSWAEKECTTYLKRAAMNNDILNTMYAIRSYAILAKIRAETFVRLERKFGGIFLPVLTPSKREGEKGKREEQEDMDRPIKRRDYIPYVGERVIRFKKRKGTDGDLDKSSSSLDDNGRGSNTSMLAKGQEGKNAGVELIVTWKIVFDPTGEAKSELWTDVRAPCNWWEVDERGALKKLTQIFRSLAEERGIYQAVIALVKLLFK